MALEQQFIYSTASLLKMHLKMHLGKRMQVCSKYFLPLWVGMHIPTLCTYIYVCISTQFIFDFLLKNNLCICVCVCVCVCAYIKRKQKRSPFYYLWRRSLERWAKQKTKVPFHPSFPHFLFRCVTSEVCLLHTTRWRTCCRCDGPKEERRDRLIDSTKE